MAVCFGTSLKIPMGGRYSLLAGFAEMGEALEEAVLREVCSGRTLPARRAAPGRRRDASLTTPQQSSPWLPCGGCPL